MLILSPGGETEKNDALSAKSANRMQLHTHAMCVDKDSLRMHILQACGTTVMTVSEELCARTAAGLRARQSIAKRVRHAETPHALKPQKEVIALMP